MILILASVLVGAILQRTSGIGFAIVVAPFVVLALGPAQGIVLVQMCGATSALLVLVHVLRDVDWGMYWRLLPGTMVGIGTGVLVGRSMSEPVAQLIAGCAMLLALLASALTGRARLIQPSTGLTVATGATAGLMTTVAGIGGVALTAYQQLTRWDLKMFVATLQPYFCTMSMATVVARVAVDTSAWPALEPVVWLGVAGCLGAGIWIGGLLVHRLPARVGLRLVSLLALVGALLTVIDALRSL